MRFSDILRGVEGSVRKFHPDVEKYQLNDEKLATYGEKDPVIARDGSEIEASL